MITARHVHLSRRGDIISNSTEEDSIEANFVHEQPIFFLDFRKLVDLGRFPRRPDDAKLLHNIEQIDRSTCLFVFISHCWLRGNLSSVGYTGFPHPDNVSGDKYKLCINGIQRLKDAFAPNMKNCFVWMDYCCIDQDKAVYHDLEMFCRIMKYCDCMFTPIADDEERWSFYHHNYFIKYGSKKWRGDSNSYLQRAWCRMEMLYAANIPLLENTDGLKRHLKFKAGFARQYKQHRRPHFLFTSNLLPFNQLPCLLPPLRHSYLEEYPPIEGHLSLEADRPLIAKLLGILQPYLDENKIEESYDGELNDQGQRHGRGEMLYANGDFYSGDWENDVKSGRGVLEYFNGAIYEGEWRNDLKDGEGKIKYAEGGYYNGQWSLDKQNGHGVICFPDGSWFEGNWVDNKRQTEGTFTKMNGDQYTGEWHSEIEHGQGSCTYADGSSFDGQWENGKRHGQGSSKYANGDEFIGEWVNDKRHGSGKIVYSNGNYYAGMWANGVKFGFGVYDFGGDIYTGEWNINQNGKGTLCCANGDEYEGDWVDGQKEGYGVLRYECGDVYEGYWLKGRYHGVGALRQKSGEVYTGKWKAGKKHGRFEIQSADGTILRSTWRNDLQCGPIHSVFLSVKRSIIAAVVAPLRSRSES